MNIALGLLRMLICFLLGTTTFILACYSDHPLMTAAWFALTLFLVSLIPSLRTDPNNPKIIKPLTGLIMLLLFTPLFLIVRDPPDDPPFDQLQKSNGRLVRGLHYGWKLERNGQSTLLVACADARSRSTTDCLLEIEERVVGRQVTVYHDEPYRVGRWRATLWELRLGMNRLIRYEEMSARRFANFESDRRSERKLRIFLVTGWLYWLIMTQPWRWLNRRFRKAS